MITNIELTTPADKKLNSFWDNFDKKNNSVFNRVSCVFSTHQKFLHLTVKPEIYRLIDSVKTQNLSDEEKINLFFERFDKISDSILESRKSNGYEETKTLETGALYILILAQSDKFQLRQSPGVELIKNRLIL